MSLTALQILAFSPGATAFKRADGRGLYLEIFPSGSKLWRLKYYVGGKETRIALGAWPPVIGLRPSVRRHNSGIELLLDREEFRQRSMALGLNKSAIPTRRTKGNFTENMPPFSAN